jgi:hypothetical protein
MRTLLERFSRYLIIGVLGVGLLLAFVLVVGIILLVLLVMFGIHPR